MIDHNDDDDDDDGMGASPSSSYTKRMLLWLGWEEHKGKYRTLFATTLWLLFGIFYGVLYEGWGLLYALRFVIGTLSASGSPVPVCMVPSYALPDSPCQLGVGRGIFVGTYILVGVPLWAFTLGQSYSWYTLSTYPIKPPTNTPLQHPINTLSPTLSSFFPHVQVSFRW